MPMRHLLTPPVISLFCTFTFAATLAATLVACSPRRQSPTTPNNAATTSHPEVLRLLYWQAPTILNPHLATGFKDFDAARIVYEPLASFDKNDKMVLFLAAEIPTVENGGIAKDGKSVTWKLKKDVKWSDGQPFTAQDVVFTYQFVTNPKVAASNAEYYSMIQQVKALDDYTIKITFKAVTPGWAVPFTGQTGMILPRHIFEKYEGENVREAPANQMPVGTGPYKVVTFKAGDIVVYEPNPLYWEQGKPLFKQVQLKGGGDATSAARAVLQTGDADYAFNLQVEAPILQQLESTGKGKVVATFGPQVERIMFNFTDPNQETSEGERSSVKFPHPFFNDRKVRQAFNFAIDRNTIANQLYGKTGRATAQLLVSPRIYRTDKITSEFNLKKAATLLDAAGWKDTNGNGIRDKKGIEMKVVFQTSVNPLRQKTQEIIKQALQSIGVAVEIKSIDPSIFFSGDPANPNTLNRFYADLQELTTGNNSPDPGPHLKWWTCEEAAQKANNWQKSNYSRYCNPKYDQLWQQSVTELNPQKRAELFKKMDELLAEDAAVIPIVERASAQGVSNQLGGIHPSPWDANTWDIKNWQRQS